MRSKTYMSKINLQRGILTVDNHVVGPDEIEPFFDIGIRNCPHNLPSLEVFAGSIPALSGPLSTARAVTAGVTRNVVQLHASIASSEILSCRRPHAINPPHLPCPHLSISKPTPLPLAADVLYGRPLRSPVGRTPVANALLCILSSKIMAGDSHYLSFEETWKHLLILVFTQTKHDQTL